MAFTATVYCIECAFGGVVCAMYCVLTTAYQVLRVMYETYLKFTWNQWALCRLLLGLFCDGPHHFPLVLVAFWLVACTVVTSRAWRLVSRWLAQYPGCKWPQSQEAQGTREGEVNMHPCLHFEDHHKKISDNAFHRDLCLTPPFSVHSMQIHASAGLPPCSGPSWAADTQRAWHKAADARRDAVCRWNRQPDDWSEQGWGG